MHLRACAACLALFCVASCSDGSAEPSDAGDAGTADVGSADAGDFADAGDPDAGEVDAGCACDDPPPDRCEGDVQVRYRSGACEGSECAYPREDTACANGCRDGACVADVCAGIACHSPPACHEHAGLCVGGECTYTPSEDGTSCDDGDPCTADACEDGACIGVAITCTTPPASECVDGALRTYESTGTCASGDCEYAFTDTPCAAGCDAGACLPECTDLEWTSEWVGSGGDWGGATSIAVASDGGVHVAYTGAAYVRNYGGRQLFHGYRAPGGGWTSSLVVTGTGNDLPDTTSIVLDPAGVPHIAFPGLGDWSVHHAERASDGSWAIRSVGPGSSSASMAIAPDGTIHLAHDDIDTVSYAYRDTSGTWSDGVVGADRCVSIALGTDGAVHMSYVRAVDDDTSELYYSVRPQGGVWAHTRVDTLDYGLDGYGCDTSIGVDPSGGVHIAYAELFVGMHYAYLAPLAPAWTTEYVGGARQLALAVDRHGGVHVAAGAAYLYRPAGGTWTAPIATPWVASGGQDPSIAVGDDGVVHIATYQGQSPYGVYYARGRVCP
jgi:hypothetical protein